VLVEFEGPPPHRRLHQVFRPAEQFPDALAARRPIPRVGPSI